MQQGPTNGQLVFIAIIILLILSAIPTTATFSMYVGFFLLFIAWAAAYQTGGLQGFINELSSKGSNP